MDNKIDSVDSDLSDLCDEYNFRRQVVSFGWFKKGFT